jgi:hypothetical protein
MTERPRSWIRPEPVLDEPLIQGSWVDGDVFQVDDHTWAIHGVIPVDGEVILAEFDKPEDAQAVLESLAVTSRDEGAP